MLNFGSSVLGVEHIHIPFGEGGSSHARHYYPGLIIPAGHHVRHGLFSYFIVQLQFILTTDAAYQEQGCIISCIPGQMQ